MSFKIYTAVCAFLALAGVLPVFADDAGAIPQAAAKTPTLTILEEGGTKRVDFETADFDFGQATPLDAAPILHDFTLQNDSAVPVTIARVQPACGCTTALLGTDKTLTLPLTLAPGQKTQVHIAIDPSYLLPGHLHKIVLVALQGVPVPLSLQMTGQLSPAIRFSSIRADFGRVSASALPKSIPLQITLDPRLLTPGMEPRLVSSNPDIQIETGALDKAANVRSYRLTLPRGTHLGNLFGAITLMPPDPNQPVVKGYSGASLPINGEIVGDFTASLSALFFGSVVSGQTATQQVILTGTSPQALHKVTATTDSPYVTVAVSAITPEGPGTGQILPRKLLDISIKPDAPLGNLQAQLHIVTGSGQQMVLPVNLYIVAPPSP